MQVLMRAYINEVINHDATLTDLDERLEVLAQTEEQIALHSVRESTRRRKEQIAENQLFLRDFAELLPRYNNIDEIAAFVPLRARNIARTVLWRGSPSWIIGSAPDEQATIFQRTKLLLLPVAGRLQPNLNPSAHSVVNRRLLASRMRVNTTSFQGVSAVKPSTPGSTTLRALDPHMDGHRDVELDDLTLIRYRVPQHLISLAGQFACNYNFQKLLDSPIRLESDLQKEA